MPLVLCLAGSLGSYLGVVPPSLGDLELLQDGGLNLLRDGPSGKLPNGKSALKPKGRMLPPATAPRDPLQLRPQSEAGHRSQGLTPRPSNSDGILQMDSCMEE